MDTVGPGIAGSHGLISSKYDLALPIKKHPSRRLHLQN